MNNLLIEIIVAVRNEEETIPLFIKALDDFDLPKQTKFQVTFIEDSSTDKTKEIIRELADKRTDINYYFLKKGYGQSVAIAYGLLASKADAIIMMDVDGGHPFETIPLMIEQFLKGSDAVQAVRRKIASRSAYRDIGSFLFSNLFATLTGVNLIKQNVYFRLLGRKFIDALSPDKRWLHFLRINYASFKDLNVNYIEFEAKERTLGQSKYNFKRLLKLAWVASFAVISRQRFNLYILLLFILSISLFSLGFPALAILPCLAAIIGLKSFYKLAAINVISLVETAESKRQQ
ncbi:MAG: glycosyltransferase [Deltaproteobacteria bacterium]|nr:glycosyltransferase [Deltaproteobacteria bacterium]